MTESEITYPRSWTYRIVGTDDARVRSLVEEILGTRAFTLDESRRSANDRYVSLRLEVEVEDEADRNDIFQRLMADETVKMVL